LSSELFNHAQKLGMHRILFLPDIRVIQKPDTGYPAGQSGIRPDTGYQKRPAGYPVHPY
jgi:hypothetical protein